MQFSHKKYHPYAEKTIRCIFGNSNHIISFDNKVFNAMLITVFFSLFQVLLMFQEFVHYSDVHLFIIYMLIN